MGRLAFAVSKFAPVVDLDGTGSLDDVGDVTIAVSLKVKSKQKNLEKENPPTHTHTHM